MVPSHYTFGLNEHFSHSITFHKHLLENTECLMRKYNTEWNIIKLLPWIFSILSPFVSSSLMGGLILEVLLCPWTISASNSSWEVRVLGATGRVCFCEPFIYKKKQKINANVVTHQNSSEYVIVNINASLTLEHMRVKQFTDTI